MLSFEENPAVGAHPLSDPTVFLYPATNPPVNAPWNFLLPFSSLAYSIIDNHTTLLKYPWFVSSSSSSNNVPSRYVGRWSLFSTMLIYYYDIEYINL